jgi:hypothetical protein
MVQMIIDELDDEEIGFLTSHLVTIMPNTRSESGELPATSLKWK